MRRTFFVEEALPNPLAQRCDLEAPHRLRSEPFQFEMSCQDRSGGRVDLDPMHHFTHSEDTIGIPLSRTRSMTADVSLAS